MKKTQGIHHITAIVGNPQENVDFYAGVLGLRLVKKTVNFDDPDTYHFYFGNKNGDPGTIITFFPWVGARKGIIGGGQVGVTTYLIPRGSMPFWLERLIRFNIKTTITQRFGETYLSFNDIHGLQLELVERETLTKNDWTFGAVTSNMAIQGFGGGILLSTNYLATEKTLTKTLGLEKIDEDDEFIRFKSTADIGNIIDLKKVNVRPGLSGVGTVHHIAWRALDDQDQLEWQELIHNDGYSVTNVRDRNYFNAIYFREHGDILFEVATNPPGFAIDESIDTLGEALKLPLQYEGYREQLNQVLPKIVIRKLDK